jgi:hypothetical protein
VKRTTALPSLSTDRSLRYSRSVKGRGWWGGEVEIAVVVVIEKSSSGAHVLGHIEAAGHAVEVNEVEPDGGGDVDEEIFGRRPTHGSNQ